MTTDHSSANVTDDEVVHAVAAILDDNARTRAEFLAAIAGLSDERRRECWSGEWSLHDILAHVIAWQDGFAHGLEQAVRGERPQVPGFDPTLEDGTDRFNAAAADAARGLSWDALMERLDDARARQEAAVRSVVGALTADRFEEGRSAHRLASSANNDREHIPQIIEWRRNASI